MIDWKDVNKELPDFGDSEGIDVICYYSCDEIENISYMRNRFEIIDSLGCRTYNSSNNYTDRMKQITHWAYINKPQDNK